MMDDIGLNYWVSGFCDGEACFGVYNYTARTGARTSWFVFKITLRFDDVDTLRKIKAVFGVGRLVQNVRNGKSNRQASYIINDVNDLSNIVVPFFRRFPLRSKKRVDFEMFAELVDIKLRSYRKHMSPDEWQSFNRKCDALKLVKKPGGAHAA